LSSKNLFTIKPLFVNNKIAVHRRLVVMSLLSCHSDSAYCCAQNIHFIVCDAAMLNYKLSQNCLSLYLALWHS